MFSDQSFAIIPSYGTTKCDMVAFPVVADNCLVATSRSCDLYNVLNAIDYTHQVECVTLRLCGFSGGQLKLRVKVWAPVDDMRLCEDVHAIVGHIAMKDLVS